MDCIDTIYIVVIHFSNTIGKMSIYALLYIVFSVILYLHIIFFAFAPVVESLFVVALVTIELYRIVCTAEEIIFLEKAVNPALHCNDERLP